MPKDEKESRQCWETPQDFYDMLHNEFNFDIDVAANEHNTKCLTYRSEDSSALGFDSWLQFPQALSAWCNPPYANPMPWIDRARNETQYEPGSVCVMLLNHDPSTKWYSKALQCASEIRILTNKRLQFVAPDGIKASSNSKPQCVIVFRRKLESAPCHVWHWDWQKDLKGE